MAFPSYPPLPSLRLATAADLRRIADLSVLGFKDSEIFRFERPRYEEFPQDAVASFANIYRSQLLDPRGVVIVAEDWFRSDEASHFSPPAEREEQDATARRVVVGVASWRLPEGSKRTGQFIVPNVGDPEPALNRDLSKRRLDLFTPDQPGGGEEIFYRDEHLRQACCASVLPSPWPCDIHAGLSQRLSDMDEVDQGVIPSHMGEPVYVGMGYEVIGEVQIPDDGEVKGFSQRVVVYRASG